MHAVVTLSITTKTVITKKQKFFWYLVHNLSAHADSGLKKQFLTQRVAKNLAILHFKNNCNRMPDVVFNKEVEYFLPESYSRQINLICY